MGKLAVVAVVVVGLLAAVSPAEKRRQYVPPGMTASGRPFPVAGLPVALDVAGGRDRVYFQQAVDSNNITKFCHG